MRFLAPIFLLASLTYGAMLPVGKPAPPLKINEPGGKQMQLSDFKGKVVVVQFLYTWCPHCQKFSKMLTAMQKDLGPKGFQPVGVAFDAKVDPSMATDYVKQNMVGFPVGYLDRPAVMKYLGVSEDERFAVPQILILDRTGKVRYQTTPLPDEKYFHEDALRAFVNQLLNEPEAKVNAKATPKAMAKTK